MRRPKPMVLMILDGWGYREATEYNAIAQAHTPTWDHLWATYPHTLISGSGLDVGLPTGQMGNSEVGHLHMGAGRLVPQDLVRINLAIADGSFYRNSFLVDAVQTAIKKQKAIHIFGLLSPGGVHSHEDHIAAMIQLAADQHAKNVYLHAILDGRDTPPRSALPSLAKIEKLFHTTLCGKIATIAGRYYSMDRDKRWDRTQLAYQLYTQGDTPYHANTAADALEQAYERDENDEFVKPTLIGDTHIISDGDAVIFMNFRADRARQLTRAFTEKNFSGFKRETCPALSSFTSLTQYAADIDTKVAFPPINLRNVFGEYISNLGLTQLRIAETEKYAHVTFFFNGGQETPFKGEVRILVESPKVATYDLVPEMSAFLLTDKLLDAIDNNNLDVIILNFANADMVGHTGKMDAAIKAVEAIDVCLKRITDKLTEVGGEVLITADHGNVELMYDEARAQPHTAHTTNPVPLLYVGRPAKPIAEGSLIDISPTLCYLMGIAQPDEMTGNTLFELTP